MEIEVKKELTEVIEEVTADTKSQIADLTNKVKVLEEKKISVPALISSNEYKGYNLRKQMGILKAKGMKEEHADFVAKAYIEAIDASKSGRKMSLKAAAAHVEGTTTAGGFLVLDDYFDMIETGARELSVMAPLCRNVSTASDTFILNKNDQEFSVAIDAEGTVTQASSTLAQVSIPVKRISVYGAVSNELLADASWDVAGWITEQVTYKSGQTLDTQILNGTGTGASNLNSGVLTAAVTNSVVLSGANLSSLTADNLSLALTKISQLDRTNATYVFGDTGMHYIRTLKDSNNSPIYQPIAAMDLNKIYGKPAVECASVSDATSSASTAYGVVGDFNKVFLVNRTNGMDLLVDPYSDSISNNTRFIYQMRKGFGIARGNALCRFLTSA
jgi:HK97 family phage major capsid protein